jgi:hypothetical protein
MAARYRLSPSPRHMVADTQNVLRMKQGARVDRAPSIGLILVLLALAGLTASGCGSSAPSTSAPKGASGTSGPGKPARAPGRKRRVRVPNVVGDRPGEAHQALTSARFRPDRQALFGPIVSGVCIRPASNGKVIDERPRGEQKPGRRIGLAFDRYVEVSCANSPPAASRECGPGDLSQHVYDGTPGFAGGSEYGLVGFKIVNVGTEDCELDAPVTVSITRDGEPVRGASGSPASFAIHTRLPVGHRFTGQWIWAHWCGDARGLGATFDLLGKQMTEPKPRTTRCEAFGVFRNLSPYAFALVRFQRR